MEGICPIANGILNKHQHKASCSRPGGTLGALSHLQVSSCHTEALGVIGLVDGTDTEEQDRREEDSEALWGKQVFPLLIELTALSHAGPFPGPGAAGQRNKTGQNCTEK